MGSLTFGCILGAFVATIGAILTGSDLSSFQAVMFLSAATIARAIERLAHHKGKDHAPEA